MNAREKKLAMAVGAVLGLLVAGFGVKAAIMQPLKKIDKQQIVYREKLAKLKSERRAYFAAEDSLKQIARRTFADQASQASASSGEMLTRQILASGLREADFSRLPVGPRKVRGASEIGWSVQGQGKLANVINLVFLLQESPYIHRIENLTLSAGEAFGHVRVGFRFLSLVLDSVTADEPVALESKVTLEGPERAVYDGIVTRDLLRPYIKRPPGKSDNAEPPSTPAGPATFQIVSLSEWMGQPEVHVRNLTEQQTQRYHVGDELAEGTIVAVDYRALPMPGKDELNSFSRVIIKIEDEFWAIEQGQTLADKRRLTAEQLPKSLVKL